MSSPTLLRRYAPGKVNLCLFIGERREDGLHELVSLVQPVSLCDELTLEIDPPGVSRLNTVVCPGITGPNLAEKALDIYREESAWDGPAVRLTITKRVPIAAGMGGGSSDAAAALRLIAQAAGVPDDPLIKKIAPRLGADVPALLFPQQVLMTGAGEVVERGQGNPGGDSTAENPFGLLILPHPAGLSTPDVYREFDRTATPRTASELQEIATRVRECLKTGSFLPPELVTNDLEPHAKSLCPSLTDALAHVRSTGADHVLVSGSGPTVFGIFLGIEGYSHAQAAAQVIQRATPEAGAVAALPIMDGSEFPQLSLPPG